jgi:isocitrate dehydrogenase
MTKLPTIVYTKTDEAPLLATYSLLPILQAFAKPAGIQFELSDISLAGRIVAAFKDLLPPAQQESDELSRLGELTKEPGANIIKLPNISASVPQLKAAIAELQAKGFALPDYLDDPQTPAQKDAKARYDKVKGSAVNPVLREGNSDRRAPPAVKAFARKNPHSMGAWAADSKSHVSTMAANDFFANEKSVTLSAATTARIELVKKNGDVQLLKEKLSLTAGEILDGTFISKKALVQFLEREIADSKAQGILFSLHMKATMMKVSDPIIFGEAVRVFFADLFSKYGSVLERIGADPRNGFGDVLGKLQTLNDEEKAPILAEIQAIYGRQPELAMVDSDKGITNLHVPSDVIVDASMPAMIRTSGRMWNRAGKLADTKAVIPDSSYAGVYAEVFQFCKEHGAFDPKTMGSVPNVGLMAQKAEEYGSHDKTFEISAAGTVRVVDAQGTVLLSHEVEAGDIWRACQTRDGAVKDWVKLAVSRARLSKTPAIFWLDAARAHDRELIAKVKAYLGEHDTTGLELEILSPVLATRKSLIRIKAGQDTISVTGNVLRDYLTDLFPILELGTSAKMLSIVPLMNGGGLFETGAGGSAPKHVQQFEKENYLRWDSLGEFLALGASFDHLANTAGHKKARILSDTLDRATGTFLAENKSPARQVGELDNRGSHFYLALYWAEELGAQNEDVELKSAFAPIASALRQNEAKIVGELNGAQGQAMNVGGYYRPNDELAAKAMRPSATLNGIIDSL